MAAVVNKDECTGCESCVGACPTEAIEMVDRAAREGFPYSLIFMDVRMPPGIDGIQTTSRIWSKHENIEVIICSTI